ncbi:MutT1 [Rothia aeria]|uniref:MutT1 n=1 Tax=Rothia aeria TaxID=172042 RepID=A0A2Z5R4X1_9MICC|nr:MutT1 [Rothia aeria]
MSIKKARTMLTNPSDLQPLEAFENLWATSGLDTHPIIIARHTKAKPRANWSAAEDERPLAGTGKRQALALARLLPAWEPSRVLSSPWLRCVQTVAPYVNEYSLTVKEKKSLSEAGAERHPKRTAKTIASLFEKGTPALVCTHRPVLPVVLDAVAEHLLTKKQKEHLPAKDPYLEPGTYWCFRSPRTNAAASYRLKWCARSRTKNPARMPSIPAPLQTWGRDYYCPDELFCAVGALPHLQYNGILAKCL